MDKPLIVSLNSKLYDVSAFASKHPGGAKVLKAVAGQDLTMYMNGSQRIIQLKHEHSKSAYDILERYAIDQSIEQDSLLDSKNAILWRVGDLHESYWRWIHQPFDGTLRLFESDFLERLTRTAWWVVPMVWLPIIFYFYACGLNLMYERLGLSSGCIVAGTLFLAGILCWTLLEYVLHRGLFHWQPDPKSYGQITFHFLLHGLHHKTPMDGDRLVFPPTAALIIVAIFYTFYRLLLPYPIFCCFCSGKLFGYVCYDMVHFYLHHGSPEPHSSLHYRKVYHHNHHFKDVDLAFGISTTLWDYVFGTVGAGPL